MFEIDGKYNSAKVFATVIEEECITQIMDLCNQKWLEGLNIAIMPDCHAGKGATIGTTITLQNKVSPSLVGVDISCGMLIIKVPNELNIEIEKIDEFINDNIPSGFEINPQIDSKINYGFLNDLRCIKQIKNLEHIKKSLGSLGGGNHFIEINQAANQDKYLVVHSGSRNLGKQVAEIYQDMADKNCNEKVNHKNREEIIKKLKLEGRSQEIQKALEHLKETEKTIPYHLCYVSGKDFEDYLHDCHICSQYASMNRREIAFKILKFIVKDNGYNENTAWLKETKENQYEFGYIDNNINIISNGWQTIHNYIGKDNILRKGAISAKKGEKVIIPVNMKDGSIIAVGKGNSNYNYSGPHGAGRLLSRSKAKEKISLEEFEDAMKDIYTTSVCQSTIDESPMAYKNIEDIIDNIQDTVDILEIIKPIYNFKAH